MFDNAQLVIDLKRGMIQMKRFTYASVFCKHTALGVSEKPAGKIDV